MPKLLNLCHVIFQVGSRWNDVKELFKKGHYQPLLLLYTCREAKPIDVSTAPTTDVGELCHILSVILAECCFSATQTHVLVYNG